MMAEWKEAPKRPGQYESDWLCHDNDHVTLIIRHDEMVLEPFSGNGMSEITIDDSDFHLFNFITLSMTHEEKCFAIADHLCEVLPFVSKVNKNQD